VAGRSQRRAVTRHITVAPHSLVSEAPLCRAFRRLLASSIHDAAGASHRAGGGRALTGTDEDPSVSIDVVVRKLQQTEGRRLEC
jgi:hypothetical protein